MLSVVTWLMIYVTCLYDTSMVFDNVQFKGVIEGVECVILARHGRKHQWNPSNVNYRANFLALQQAGVLYRLVNSRKLPTFTSFSIFYFALVVIRLKNNYKWQFLKLSSNKSWTRRCLLLKIFIVAKVKLVLKS